MTAAKTGGCPRDPERAAHKERTENGIPMTGALVEEIRQVCDASEAPFLLKE